MDQRLRLVFQKTHTQTRPILPQRSAGKVTPMPGLIDYTDWQNANGFRPEDRDRVSPGRHFAVLDAWSGPSSLSWGWLSPCCCAGGFRASFGDKCPCWGPGQSMQRNQVEHPCSAQIRSALKSCSIFGREGLGCSNWSLILTISYGQTMAHFR
jgi:hypothetical protein